MSSMIIDSAVMTAIECLRPLRGADRTCPGSMMTGARIGMSGGSQSTQESPGLMRGQFLYKVWSTETEHIEKDWTEIVQLVAEFMSPDLNASVEPLGLLRSLPTLGWQRE